MKKHKVFVYGTLRPGNTETVKVPAVMYSLGPYPGIRLTNDFQNGPFVICEVLEVTDDQLAQFDRYEGYDPKHLMDSLYLRVPFQDGWIYQYNRDLSHAPIIPGGDWLQFRQQVKPPKAMVGVG